MQFADLPVEIIIMILRKLDFRSLLSMYNTCKSFRNTVCAYNVIIECNISMNVMATVNTLKLNFFRDISNHLQILNMRGVPDLFKTKVLPAFKKLKCLKILDISYTNLNILDLMELHCVCPTLKDVTINFAFSQSAIVQITQNTLLKCQSVFENFEKVHFFGSLNNLLDSKLAINILKNAKLSALKFSAVEVNNVHTSIMKSYSECQMPHFKHFAVYLINWRSTNTYKNLNNFPVLSMIELKNYEFLIIYKNANDVSVCSTSIFNKFFSENFNVTVECVTDLHRSFIGNVAIMIWNKETTQFDNIFFHKLYEHVKQYFPYFLKSGSDITVPQKYNWVYIAPIAPDAISEDEGDVCDYPRKRSRMTMENLMLNYDDVFKEKRTVQLSFIFNTPKIAAVTLKKDYEYLRKITFLLFQGIVYYSADFFKILFECCHSLETLSVESSPLSPCTFFITRFIKLSKTLRNIHLIDRSMNFTDIFSSFAQCQTLENICVIDLRQWEHNQFADPSLLLESCPNLCSVVIQAPFSESAKVKQLQLFSKAKIRLKKPHVKVIVNQMSDSVFKYNYDPFLDVFKFNPIKPI